MGNPQKMAKIVRREETTPIVDSGKMTNVAAHKDLPCQDFERLAPSHSIACRMIVAG